MSIKGKSEITHIKIDPQIYLQINPQVDKRVQMIYDRYRTGKSIILDDLRYLFLRDPEGCKKLAKSIIEAKNGKEQESEPGNVVSIGYKKINSEKANEQRNYIENISINSDTSNDSIHNVLITMSSVKSLIENMSENELMDMMNNLNEAIELKKLASQMKYWEDEFIDKMVAYTYEEEKEFDKLA